VKLHDLTVLVGPNNSGKTSFLEALGAAIGMGRRSVSAEDIFLAPGEAKAPPDRTAMVDVLIRPVDPKEKVLPTFPPGSFWLTLWGIGVAQDDNDHDFVAIRTQVKWDQKQGDYVLERRFLVNWPSDPHKWADAKANERAGSVSIRQIEPFGLSLIDAKRDIHDEMLARGSFWHRLVSDLHLTDAQIKTLEKRLSKLNASIISASEVLRHVQASIDDLHHATDSDKGAVSITPTARSLRDLSRGMDVSFATRGAQAFPIARHGMGTRSLAALLTFRAYITWRQKKMKGGEFHPMLGLEEPEAHLHPQAQRALFRLIKEFPGQRIISTHSAYIAAEAQISQFRLFRKVGAQSNLTSMDTSSLSKQDLRKINRMVMNTRGDLLYARMVVFMSGETEEQALPQFGERYWGRHPNDLGISMLGVGGDGSYLPFIRLAASFGIPWYIFSDGEPDAQKKVTKALETIGQSWPSDRVIQLPAGKNFEQYVTTTDYQKVLIAMIISLEGKNERHKKALEEEWAKEAKPLTRILDYLADDKNKTKCAKPLAEAITAHPNPSLRFPGKVRELFEAISRECQLKPKKSI